MPRSTTRAATTLLLLAATAVATTLTAPLATALPPAATAAVCPPAGGATVADAPTPATGALVVQGHGWGHSLGMSQYGAQGAARLGCSAPTILSTYYPGTTITTPTLRTAVRLRLLSNEKAGRSTVQAQDRPLTWLAVSGRKTVIQPKGTVWSVQRRADGRGLVLRDDRGFERFWVARSGVLQLQERGAVARVRSLGGTSLRTDLRMRWDDTEFTASATGLSAEQVLRDDATGAAVQKYLWGLAEVPASWPAAALQAQAVAARTYLVAGYAPATDPTTYRIGTTTATQHYGGVKHELEDAAAGGAWRAAVDATAGQVVTAADGTLIDAVFTSSLGGRSEDVRYVWGGSGVPYLSGVDDSRWDAASDNPFRSWSVGMTQSEVARRFGFDSVTDVRLGAPASTDRLAGVIVTGSRGGVVSTRTFTGWAARQALGVRSPSFTLQWLVPATSQPLSGDFDGDGRGDVGWFASGRVTLLTAAGARRTYTIGGPTSRAVVGDFDGNGKDSVGVVTGIRWCLRNLVRSGGCDVGFDYGTPTDIPVAGRWHGGRADGIGVWRSGQWFLKDVAGAGPTTARLSWGRPGDLPVTGDWDGDGRDTQGVVRAGRWFAATTLDTASPSTTFQYGGPADRFVVGTWAGGRRSLAGVVAGSTFFLRVPAGTPGTGVSTRLVTLAP